MSWIDKHIQINNCTYLVMSSTVLRTILKGMLWLMKVIIIIIPNYCSRQTDRWRRMQANFKSLCLCRKWKKRHCLRPGDTKLDQHQHQHWDFGGGCHNFRSPQRRQNSSVYISTLTGSIIAMGDHTHILIFSYLVLLSDCKLLSCESRLISLFLHLW